MNKSDRGQYRGLIISIVVGALAIYVVVALARAVF